MNALTRIPAAQYLRISTEHQQYSLQNQAAAIQEYAQAHGFVVVRTYEDPGRSGLLLKHRLGLQRLLADVVNGEPNFRAILVYDVSRWGRFQDTDEAAHYEFVCRQKGIQVHYCAESFHNDCSSSSSILKTLKRTMAAEYSRDLGMNVYAAMKRVAALGFQTGGVASFGLRRMVVSADGKHKRRLCPGEYKYRRNDRITLVSGPTREVECVRQIFRKALKNKITQIVEHLNGRGIASPRNKRWTYCSVQRLLANPKYFGCNAWGRTAQRLTRTHAPTDPKQWVLVPGAFRGIIGKRTFDLVQAAHPRACPISDEALLDKLKRLLAARGRPSEDIMERSCRLPSVATYHARFGSLRRAFELVGYPLSHKQLAVSENHRVTRHLRENLLEEIEAIFPGEVKRVWRNRRVGFKLDDGTDVSVLIARYYRTPILNRIRWVLATRPAERTMLTLLCLDRPNHKAFQSFYLMRGMNIPRQYRIKSEADPWLRRGLRLRSLSDFYAAARAAMRPLESSWPESIWSKTTEVSPTMRRSPARKGNGGGR